MLSESKNMSDEIPLPPHSEVLQHVIDSLFHVISQNTTPSFAWLTLRIMLQKNCYSHQFLHHVDIGEIEKIQNCNCNDPSFQSVSIATVPCEIDTVNIGQLGQCIYDLIQDLRNQMGTQAGYILIHQFRNDLGEQYYQALNQMGVDLQLAEVQYELYGWEGKKSETPSLTQLDK